MSLPMAGPHFLVTGAGGFIGARVVEAANARGARLVTVDRMAAFQTRAEHRGLDFGTKLEIEALESYLAGGPKLDAVIHLGACTDTMERDESVHERLNVAYSKMLWTWCANARLPLVYASSAATYGAGEHGYDDDEKRLDALVPLNPYGWSKHRFDLWALAREREGLAPPTWSAFKFFNVYGFGERHKGRMASVVLQGFDQIRGAGKMKLFKSYEQGVANGDQRRDFVFVDDVVDVLLFAARGDTIRRGIYNFGTGTAHTFNELGRTTFRALGMPENIEFIEMPVELRERYQYFTQANMERLRAAGYDKPFTSLEEGIDRYVRRLVKECGA
jgi:ADP-L-glycero-D-manno-heptose 6-epimerase